jgi:threonine dehydrogenase-like Zn-dependent dehydrogenase
MISTTDIGCGWSQPCQPHQLSGWLTARTIHSDHSVLGSGSEGRSTSEEKEPDMTTMRAAVVAGPKRFEVQDMPVPEVQPGGVLVRVRNCGICGSDLHFYKGDFPSPPGMRLGHEISGEVAALGAGVEGLSAGQPVAIEPVEVCRQCNYCLTGREQLCPERKFLGTMLPGAFAEYIHVPAHIVHPLPEGLDFEVGALVEPLAVTVHGLRQVQVSFGERVAVLGSGTIGLMAVVAARALGATEVIATARYPHQAGLARALGADHVVEAGEQAVAQLLAASGGRQPEVVVETVGGHADTVNEAITLVQPGGRVSLLGIFSQAPAANVTLAVLKEVMLLGGITYGHVGGRSDFKVALKIARRRADDLRRVITHRVKLEEIERGFATAADKAQQSVKVTVELEANGAP